MSLEDISKVAVITMRAHGLSSVAVFEPGPSNSEIARRLARHFSDASVLTNQFNNTILTHIFVNCIYVG